MWVMELFLNTSKTEILKVYLFKTAREIAYVLDCDQTEVYNYYHNLINARGKLRYVKSIPKKYVGIIIMIYG